jgi:UDP-galactopyranose mutase
VGADKHGRAAQEQLQHLLSRLLLQEGFEDYLLWYYTPMALRFSRHLQPVATVYDCMDELSAFAGASPDLIELERELLRRSDAVFTGGHSLFEAKQRLHPRVHCFPSSVDVEHFASARGSVADPPDQLPLARPRLGYYGVIDERLDLTLIAEVAAARPQWQIVLIGPVTKIDEAQLPRAANIHYLGQKPYQALPGYVAGWDVALMPFARNEATRYISPTKTPEYLAAGRPVVSTSIRDVVRMYGAQGLVRIADTPVEVVRAIEDSLREDPLARLGEVDRLLREQSWDRTWASMDAVISSVQTPAGMSKVA